MKKHSSKNYDSNASQAENSSRKEMSRSHAGKVTLQLNILHLIDWTETETWKLRLYYTHLKYFPFLTSICMKLKASPCRLHAFVVLSQVYYKYPVSRLQVCYAWASVVTLSLSCHLMSHRNTIPFPVTLSSTLPWALQNKKSSQSWYNRDILSIL